MMLATSSVQIYETEIVFLNLRLTQKDINKTEKQIQMPQMKMKEIIKK